MTRSANRQQRVLHFDPMATIGVVEDRPLTQLRGSQRLQYVARRISAYLNVLLTEPAKLGIYPALRLLPFFALGGLVPAMVVDVTLAGTRLDLGFYVFTPLLVLLFLLSVVVSAAVAIVALDPIRSRGAWHLASIQTDAGFAAFRYRRHPRRDGYQLVDLWTTNRGAGLGFGRIVPYLIDKLGGNRSWPFRNYQIPMTRLSASVAAPDDPSVDP